MIEKKPVTPTMAQKAHVPLESAIGTLTFIPKRLPNTVCGKNDIAMNVNTFIMLFRSLL